MRRSVSSELIALQDAFAMRSERLAFAAKSPERRIKVPRMVRIKEGNLEWSMHAPGDCLNTQIGVDVLGEPIPDQISLTSWSLLRRFSSLFYSTDQAICDFAADFGVLFLDKSGLPGSNSLTSTYPGEDFTNWSLRQGRNGKSIDPGGKVTPVVWSQEPLEYWRAWSMIFRLLMSLYLELREANKALDIEEFVERHGFEVPEYSNDNSRWPWSQPMLLLQQVGFTTERGRPDDFILNDLEGEKLELGFWFDLVTKRANLAPHVDWKSGSRPSLSLGVESGLFPVWLSNKPNYVLDDLVMQLMFFVSSAANINFCPDCGTPYEVSRRRGYCPECRHVRRNRSKLEHWRKTHPSANSMTPNAD